MARKKVQPCRCCGKSIDFPEPRPGAQRVSRPKFCSDRCRLYSKVDKTPGQGPKGECWEFQGAKHKFGYGMINRSGMKASEVTTAHAYAWEIENGTVPDSLYVCHRCDNPACCRPEHLFLGTHQDNVDDMVGKARNVYGTRHVRAKLTEDDVERILEDSRSARKIAEEYGVSRQLIDGIRSGQRWSHVA